MLIFLVRSKYKHFSTKIYAQRLIFEPKMFQNSQAQNTPGKRGAGEGGVQNVSILPSCIILQEILKNVNINSPLALLR